MKSILLSWSNRSQSAARSTCRSPLARNPLGRLNDSASLWERYAKRFVCDCKMFNHTERNNMQVENYRPIHRTHTKLGTRCSRCPTAMVEPSRHIRGPFASTRLDSRYNVANTLRKISRKLARMCLKIILIKIINNLLIANVHIIYIRETIWREGGWCASGWCKWETTETTSLR